MEHELSVVVDHHQFYLHDANPDFAPDFTFNDLDTALEALPAGLMITTRRAAGSVPVVVSLVASRPGDDFDDWLHVVEASLTISSGGLTVSSPWNEAASALPLVNGSYGAIVYYGDVDTAEYDNDNGADHYRAVLWLADPQPTRVLKRYEDEDEVLPYNGNLSVEQLAEVIQSGDISQRCHAAVSLCRLATAQAITALSTALRERNLSVAQTATAALFLAGPLAVGPTLQQLKASDAGTRQRAVEVLARLDDDEAAKPLLPAAVVPLLAALSDVEPAVRQRAAATLGSLADEQSVPLLLPLLGLARVEVRLAAVHALDALRQSRQLAGEQTVVAAALKPLLNDPDQQVRTQATRLLGQEGMSGSDNPTLAKLGDAEWTVRQAAADALGNSHDPTAVAPLVAALKDEHFAVRVAAALALGKLGEQGAVTPLIAATSDETANVRSAAVAAIGKLGGDAALDFLIAALEADDEYGTVADAAAEQLGQLRAQASVELLLVKLAEADAKVRGRVVKALGEIGDQRAIEPLLRLVGDEDATVRAAVAKAMYELNDEQAGGSLLVLLSDPAPQVRANAAEAVGRLKAVGAVEPLIGLLADAERKVRYEAAMALWSLEAKEAAKPLIGRLQDSDQAIQAVAAQALGELGDRAALPALAGLRASSSNRAVQQAAAQAIKKLEEGWSK